eukprot:3820022-Ditylum_brightwellii.AAC.1
MQVQIPSKCIDLCISKKEVSFKWAYLEGKTTIVTLKQHTAVVMQHCAIGNASQYEVMPGS